MGQNPLELFFSSLLSTSDGIGNVDKDGGKNNNNNSRSSINNNNKNKTRGLEIVADNAHIRHVPEHTAIYDALLPPNMVNSSTVEFYSSEFHPTDSVPTYPAPFLKRASRWDTTLTDQHNIPDKRSSFIGETRTSLPNSDFSLAIPSRRESSGSIDDIILDDCIIFRDRSNNSNFSMSSSLLSSSSSSFCSDSFRSRRWRQNESFHCRRISKMIEDLPLDDCRRGGPTVRSILRQRRKKLPPKPPTRESSIIDFDKLSSRSKLTASERQFVEHLQRLQETKNEEDDDDKGNDGDGGCGSNRSSATRKAPPKIPSRRSSIFDVDVSDLVSKAMGIFRMSSMTSKGSECQGSTISVSTPTRTASSNGSKTTSYQVSVHSSAKRKIRGAF